MSAPAVAHEQAVPDRRRRLLILVICSMSLLIVGLDATIVNVALPAIQRSFDATLSGLQWTVDAYTLVLASLLLLSGSTADRLGRRRVFQTGLALFSLGSLLSALENVTARGAFPERGAEWSATAMGGCPSATGMVPLTRYWPSVA